jgi:hypothetical protein
MIVIFDIDDVLMPWAEKAHLACLEAGLTDKPTWTQWNMAEEYGVPLEAWLEVVNTLVVEGGVYHAPPYPGVQKALAELVLQEHEIHLVTARGFFDHAEQIRQWTHDWIETFDIPGKLHFTQKKGAYAQHIGATHAIDDRLENVVDLQNHGVDTYLMTQPHNEAAAFDPRHRVYSVPEFVERILKHGR